MESRRQRSFSFQKILDMIHEKLSEIKSQFSEFNQTILDLLLSINQEEFDREKTSIEDFDDRTELNISSLGNQSIPINITLWKKESTSENGLSMFFFDPETSKKVEIEYFEDVDEKDQKEFIEFISSIFKSSVSLKHFLLDGKVYRSEIRCSELSKDDYFLSFDKLFIPPWKKKCVVTKETSFKPWVTQRMEVQKNL